MSLSNILTTPENPLTLEDVVPYNLVVNSIEAGNIIFPSSQFGWTYATSSSSQAFTSSVTAFLYPAPVIVDAGLNYNPSTGIFTVVDAGVFIISYTNGWDNNTTGSRHSAIVNVSTEVAIQVSSANNLVSGINTTQSGSISLTLGVGSTFFVAASTSSNCNMLGSAVSINRLTFT
jgi:hypothetical protein